MKPELTLKKHYEEYGGGPLALVWQDGVLFCKSGKVVPKDVNVLVKLGYKVPVALRLKLQTWAEEQQHARELDALKQKQRAELEAKEQMFRQQMEQYKQDLRNQETYANNPQYQNTAPGPVQQQQMPQLFPAELQAQQYYQQYEPQGYQNQQLQQMFAPPQQYQQFQQQPPQYAAPQQQYYQQPEQVVTQFDFNQVHPSQLLNQPVAAPQAFAPFPVQQMQMPVFQPSAPLPQIGNLFAQQVG